MRRRFLRWLGAAVGVLLLVWTEVAAAFEYYSPQPKGTIGIRQPTISQQLVLGEGERILEVEMWLDGEPVIPSWDETGRISYTPPAPLEPGEHRVKLRIQVAPADPKYFYRPLTQEFTFTVADTAVVDFPEPGREELQALEAVNRYRQAAGLPPLSYDRRLGAAARAHAAYLVANPRQKQIDGHREVAGSPGFTGRTPADRAVYFGYDEGVSEVVHFVDRAEEAVDGWIDSLYHRIPPLHPGVSVMGYGVAGPPGDAVNVIEAGPLDQTEGVVRWPRPGQQGVPPMWDGNEEPDPFRLYRDTKKPVGYPVTLTFGGQPRSLRLTSWSLTGPEGEVKVLHFDPVVDSHLKDTVALIPAAPLKPSTRYTVRMRGEVDLGRGPEAFDEVWSFTTGPEARPILRSRVITYQPGGEVRSVRVEGAGFAKGMQVFLGGLPVEGLEIESDGAFTFRPPVGYRGEAAHLLVVSPGGKEAVWPSFIKGNEGFRFDSADPFRPLDLVVRGQSLGRPALLHRSGAVLVPEEALTALGGRVERIDGIGRTYWQVGNREGEYIPGRMMASVAGEPVRMDLPVQRRQETIYVGVDFVERLASVQGQVVEGRLYLGESILGVVDVDGHWGQAAIRRLLEAGIVSGYGDGTFRPDATLSRAAFVKMLAAARRLDLRRGDSGSFADTAGHWVSQQGYLGAAVAAGIVRPEEYPDRRFEPDRPITREEIAVMVTRALGLEAEAQSRRVPVADGQAVLGERRFSDAAVWSRPGHIAVAVEAGIITGYAEPDGRFTFRPDRSASRAEAAVMLVRALDHKLE